MTLSEDAIHIAGNKQTGTGNAGRRIAYLKMDKDGQNSQTIDVTTDYESIPYAIALAEDGAVYITGYWRQNPVGADNYHGTAAYWKIVGGSAVKQDITTPPTKYNNKSNAEISLGNSIAVDGADVYVAGRVVSTQETGGGGSILTNTYKPVYWKDTGGTGTNIQQVELVIGTGAAATTEAGVIIVK
jgi:hypothetical protein